MTPEQPALSQGASLPHPNCSICRQRKRSHAADDMPLDRWSLIIIGNIMFSDRRSFLALLDVGPERISTRTLANRLKGLVWHGLLTRSSNPTNKRKITYSLTEASIQLGPALIELGAWGLRHSARESVPLNENAPCTWDAGQWKAFADRLRARHLIDAATGRAALLAPVSNRHPGF